eukprot:6688179-Prymnesium_polylepis.1
MVTCVPVQLHVVPARVGNTSCRCRVSNLDLYVEQATHAIWTPMQYTTMHNRHCRLRTPCLPPSASSRAVGRQ